DEDLAGTQADEVDVRDRDLLDGHEVEASLRVEPVAGHAVVELEVVVGHGVAGVAALGHIGVQNRQRPARAARHQAPAPVHGAIGLPVHRLPAGTDSPLSTSDPGPTVAPSAMTAAGRMTPLGPRVAPSPRVTVSMLMIRSWKRCVWSTHPRLTVTPS